MPSATIVAAVRQLDRRGRAFRRHHHRRRPVRHRSRGAICNVECPGKSFIIPGSARPVRAAPGTCSAIRACARIPTCTRWALKLPARGASRNRSRMAPRSWPMSATPRGNSVSNGPYPLPATCVGGQRGCPSSARWTLEVEAGDTTTRYSCNFLLTCSGYYDYSGGYTPDFPGMDSSRAGSCIRRPGHRISTMPASGSW